MAKKKTSLASFEEVKGKIQNLITTEIFETEFGFATVGELNQATQKQGWSFNWNEFSNAFHVVKVTTKNNNDVLQGLVAFTVQSNHIFMDFVEVAPHNKGKGKVYNNVAGNLLAFVCYVSVLRNHSGIVLFEPKPQLLDYYVKAYYAELLPSSKKTMYFTEPNLLINKYLQL